MTPAAAAVTAIRQPTTRHPMGAVTPHGTPHGTCAVIKLGGSFAFSPHLRAWLAAIAACAGRAVVVPGGGPFADQVRTAQPRMGFDDRAAHRMALLAMEQYGCAIAGLHAGLTPAGSLQEIRDALARGGVPVWLPARALIDEDAIAASWDVTSDSLAAWLARRIGARRLLLVKHVHVEENTVAVADLAARAIVDGALAGFLAASDVCAFLLGPQDHGALGAGAVAPTAGARIVA